MTIRQIKTSQTFKIGAQVIGFALVILAIYFAVRNVSLGAFREIELLDLALMLVAVLLNLFLTASLFHVITRSFNTSIPVKYSLMFKLIAFSSLLNYIPLIRPGLWGRAAYLKSTHQLELKDSLFSLGIVFGVSTVVFFPTAAILLFTLHLDMPPLNINFLLLVSFVLLTIVPTILKPLIRRLLLNRPKQIFAPSLWVLLKIFDMLVAAFRLYIAFQVINQPISYHTALLATSASLFVKLLGITPNGLGLSEWTIAALTAIATPVSAATGAAAALLDRAVEILITLPLGLISAMLLKNKLPAARDGC